MASTTITVSKTILKLFNLKKAEAAAKLGRMVSTNEFMQYMLDAEKWKDEK